MATNRQRAQLQNLTTREYFHYAGLSSYSWVDPEKFNFPLKEVMCQECDYIPTTSTLDPKRAYRAHLKKHHPAIWWRTTKKPYVIREESDVDDADVNRFLRAMLNA